MKVYLRPDDWLSIGIKRVARALAAAAPAGVEIVRDPDAADLTILHVVGHGGWQAERDLARRVAVIQYCLRTSENPAPSAWLPLWRHATCVWSYYDLSAYLAAEASSEELASGPLPRFYYAPLGVDGDVFRPTPQPRPYAIATSGYIAETEGVTEAARACAQLGATMFHLGPDLQLGAHVTSRTGITDAQLAEKYSTCRYVAGLRRVEGFELPVLEGLACGARPICFDAPHYRRWYGDFAEFVPEVAPAELVPHLVDRLARPPRPVTTVERAKVLDVFDWPTLARGFWERAL